MYTCINFLLIVVETLLLMRVLVGLSTIWCGDLLWMSECSCVYQLWLWCKVFFSEGRMGFSTIQCCEWVKVPVSINYDCDPKSASYSRPYWLLNYLMVLSAVNEWRLLCGSTMIVMKLSLLESGGLVGFSTIWCGDLLWMSEGSWVKYYCFFVEALWVSQSIDSVLRC